ncbi:protein NRT1/ PTR FAMILY 5.8-like [Tasmannia lanceolata]|uniref:protein NRT1/ PTR FAMILY 5.8-like n=1 Tax=Tasmannia lanceolata TaxID=3420 RepID=UPI0040642D19
MMKNVYNMADEKGSRGLSMSCVLIIVVASVERFAYKGVASNLVTYLTDVTKMSTSSAAKSVNSWCGVTSMLPLVGAILADSYWDRYSTILFSSLLYVLGLVALTSSALLWAWTPLAASSSSLFFSLYLISIGQGGYNPSLQAFGADQLENEAYELPLSKEDENSNKKKSLFFQWWYFGICIGSLLGVSLMSYIQDTFGWGWGFAIPTIAMSASIGCFSCGTSFYLHKKDKVMDKPIETLIRTAKEAARKMMTGRTSLSPKDADVIELELQDKQLQDNSDESESLIKSSNNGDTPHDDAKAIFKLLPIWAMLLMFAVIFQQPTTFFTKQGMTMKRNIGSNFVIPPATLQSAITISIVLLMPLYDKLIIPIIRLITRDDKGITVLQRMGIGMVLSIIAMVVAALVESKRLEISRKMGIGFDQSQTPTVPLCITWLLPQYILLGISDVFTVVGMQEFFYTQVPSRMRSIGIALYLSVFGFGSFLSAILISVIELVTSLSGQNSWFSDDMREARLDKYYWLLVLSSTISLLLFVSLSKNYSGRNIITESSR